MSLLPQFGALLLLTLPGLAAEWPAFRGPAGDGSTPDEGAVDGDGRLGPVAWTISLPGNGNSTPAVVGESVFVTCPDADAQLLLLCLDRQTGATRWQRRLEFGDRSAPNGLNNMGTPSPVATPDTVVAVTGLGNVHAFGPDGSLRWQHSLREGGTPAFRWFYSSSPVLAAGLVICQMSQRPDGDAYPHSRAGQLPRGSWVRALDLKSGAVRWQIPVAPEATGEDAEAYGSPVATTDTLAVSGGGRLHLLRLPDGGLKGSVPLNVRRGNLGALVATPLAIDGRWLMLGQRGQRLTEFAEDTTGSVRPGWQLDEALPEWTTPARWQEAVAVVNGNRAELLLLEPTTGKVTARTPLNCPGRTYAPPTAAGRFLSVISEEGTLLVIRRRDGKPEVCDRHAFGQSPARTTVAVAGTQHFCRVRNQLTCFRHARADAARN